MIGSACAWFLADSAGFDGSVPVIECDPSLEFASASRSASSLRQQFTTEINFVNGFSGHGLQQAPAMGRGIAELISFEEHRGINLQPLGYNRFIEGRPFLETAII